MSRSMRVYGVAGGVIVTGAVGLTAVGVVGMRRVMQGRDLGWFESPWALGAIVVASPLLALAVYLEERNRHKNKAKVVRINRPIPDKSPYGNDSA